MADKKTELEEILSHGVDIKNRRIYFGCDGDDDDHGGAFNWSSVEACVRALHKLTEGKNKKPIELHMSSAGGDSVSMMRLYDEILACPCKIIFVGGGEISSSATWIMAVCDERRLHKHTTICLHDGTDSQSDRHTDFLIGAAETEDNMNMLYQLYADNSRMPVRFWQDVLQRDLFISAEEAIQFGLADKIIEPVKRGNLRRTRINSLKKEIDPDEMKDLVKSVYKRIRRHRTLNKIEIHVPREEFDKEIYVDTSTLSEPTNTQDKPVAVVDSLETVLHDVGSKDIE